MQVSDWLLLLAGLLLSIGTGVFVASEFALVNLDRAVLESRHRSGERGLGSVIAALKRTSTHLSSAQLGINPGRLGAGSTGLPFTDTKRCEGDLGILAVQNGDSVYTDALVAMGSGGAIVPLPTGAGLGLAGLLVVATRRRR